MNPETLIAELTALAGHALDGGDTAAEQALREAIECIVQLDKIQLAEIRRGHAVVRDEPTEPPKRKLEFRFDAASLTPAEQVPHQEIPAGDKVLVIPEQPDPSKPMVPISDHPQPKAPDTTAERLREMAQSLSVAFPVRRLLLDAAQELERLSRLAQLRGACLDTKEALNETYREIDAKLKRQRDAKTMEILRLKAKLYDLLRNLHGMRSEYELLELRERYSRQRADEYRRENRELTSSAKPEAVIGSIRLRQIAEATWPESCAAKRHLLEMADLCDRLRAENGRLKESNGNAFVAGAAWWEFHQTGATMFASDKNLAGDEAVRRGFEFRPFDEAAHENKIKELKEKLQAAEAQIEYLKAQPKGTPNE